jgi:hypothetical protein
LGIENYPLLNFGGLMSKRRMDSNEVLDNEYITIMNNTFGILQLMSKEENNRNVRIEKYGGKQRVQFKDIIQMAAESSEIFEKMYALILDQRVIDYLGLSEHYKYALYSMDEIDTFLQKSENEITEFIKNCSKGTKETIAIAIKNKIDSQEKIMDSTTKIKFFEKLFNAKLVVE